MSNNNNQFLIPGAILVAGVLIAGSVVYINGPSEGRLGDSGAEEAGSLSPVSIAEAVGLNKRDFEKCLDSGRYIDAVEADTQDAIGSGGTGTPYSIAIAPNGAKFPVFGALPFEQVAAIIDAALANDTSGLDALEVNAGGPVGEIAPVTEDDHIIGSIDAPVKLIEYSDLECPFCTRFHSTAQRVVDEYDDQVAWVYRHFPLDSIHTMARPLAEGSECAAELGGNDAFWAYIGEVLGI